MKHTSHTTRAMFMAAAALATAAACSNEGDRAGEVIVLNDFDGPDWGEGWQARGDAFVVDGRPRKPPETGWEGRLTGVLGTSLVDTFVSDAANGVTLGDAATGVLTSPVFRIDRRYLNFAIDGGDSSPLSGAPTMLEVWVNDRPHSFHTGDRAFPLELQPSSLDLAAFRGGTLQVVVVDASDEGFGFISLDQLTLSDTPGAPADRVIADFEDAIALVAAGWTADGAFVSTPTNPDAWAGTARFVPDEPIRAIGSFGLSTCRIGGEDTSCAEATGSVTSPTFRLTSRYLNFAIAGGEGVQDVGLEVLASDGQVLASYQPDRCNTELTGEADWHYLDLDSFVDRDIRVRVYDDASSGCGHITVDQIYVSRTSRGVEAVTRRRSPSDVVNVSAATDAFDDVIADFDDPVALVAGGWVATGAFANPTGALSWAGTTEDEDAARIGVAAVSTCEIAADGCDTPIGELRSPAFTVERSFITFLMSGGNGMAAVGVEVLDASDRVVARYSPSSCDPSYIDGADDWHRIDVTRFSGRQVKLRVFDDAGDGCGFVSFDHFYQSDDATVGDLVATAEEPTAQDAVNVTTTPETFTSVVASFDDPPMMVENGWVATGAFADPPDADAWQGTASVDNPDAARVGARAVATCEVGGATCDEPTGTLLSPPVTVEAPYWSFLMTGGDGTVDVGLDILDTDGEVVARYRPASCAPSFIDGDDDWHHIDMTAFVGRTVRLRLQDNEVGGCGFVSFDHFHQTTVPRGDLVDIATDPTPGPDVVNVTADDDTFSDVITSFDDPVMMVADGWTATGAFADPANQDAWSGTARTSNALAARIGARAVGTCEIGGAGCDAPTGTLTSPLITVNEDAWSFLMTGGDGSADVGLDILDDEGNVVASYRPSGCDPSFIDGDDDWAHIDVSAFVGEQVRLRLRDDEAGPCGFVSFDHFYQSASGRGPLAAVAEPTMMVPVVNVTTSTDAFDDVITSFDDPMAMVANGWIATGAFASPASVDAWAGTARTSNGAAARVGTQAVGTCEIGGGTCDGPTGSLTSPLFTVNRPMLSFLMAGGNGAADVGLEITDPQGRVLVAYRPSSCAPSHIDGDDDWKHLDLSAVVGRQVRLRLFDQEDGACGFISFDHFYLSGTGRGDLGGAATPGTNATLTTDAFIDGQLIADFDDPRALIAAGWTSTGAFANPMTADAWAGSARTSNGAAARIGAQAVSSCEIGGGTCDGPTGAVTSPLITVTRRYLNFMMAGGNGAAPVGVEVLDAMNDVVASFVPDSCGPSHIDGDEDWHWIDLGGQLGDSVRIRIFDREAGGCGFVSFDHFYLSDTIRGPSLTPRTRGKVVADFEDAQTMVAAGWTATGAFAAPMTADAWTGTSRLRNQFAARVGRGAVSTCEIGAGGCDAPTGALRSPLFTVDARYLNFAMSGGNGAAAVGLEVLSPTDAVLASFTPNQCGPSYIDGRDDWHHIDLMSLANQQVRLRIFDADAGGCGFVSFDHFFFSDTPEGTAAP